MQAEGHPIESIRPGGTLYLSVRFDLFGRTVNGIEVRTNEDLRKVLLREAGMAVVPFQAFGLVEETGWVRLSVGAVSMDAIRAGVERLRAMFRRLQH